MTNPVEYDAKAPYSAKQSATKEKFTIHAADRELLKRPSFSFRLQLILGFLLFFILSMAISIGAMVAINRIQQKTSFLQASSKYLFEIEQARRWEKNYFLYGTNLDDATRCAGNAAIVLSENLQHFKIVPFPEQTEAIVRHLDTYRSLLNELVILERRGIENAERKHEIETSLRGHGAEMVKTAASLASKEQESVNTTLHLLQQAPIYALVVLLLLGMYVAHFLSQRVIRRLAGLVDCTHRIAKGDFSPITPTRKYRDEITTVDVAINRMIEELDAHQAAMMESHKLRAIGTLTAGVAHELNNPLNNIMLTAHSLLEDHQGLREDELIEMINDLISETDRSRSIVRNLLDFTRESESVAESVELGALVDKTIKLALNQAKVSGVKIDVSIQSNLPYIRGDRQQLKQVFLNLVLNALDAVEKNGKIKITVEKAPTPGFLNVHVEDNGCGIPAHLLPRIFDPFFTTKAPGKGTGLGLSVTHGIVTKHGGKIDVASEEGKYTRITVSLPFDRYSQGF
ncbi:MAG: ATP-binding protein [Pseudomonadota bacterium]